MALFMLELCDKYKAAEADLTEESKWEFALIFLLFNKNYKKLSLIGEWHTMQPLFSDSKGYIQI